MSNETLKGRITYINHSNQNATIEYIKGAKKKEVHTNVSAEKQQEWKAAKMIKKTHVFHVGDDVKFELELSARGDKQMATHVQYLGNTELANLLNRATRENKFTGYLKMAEDKYFVKETGSYFLFPLKLSPWERKPSPDTLNEPVSFVLEQFDSPNKVTAKLQPSVYILEYRTAEKLFKQKEIIQAKVYKVSPHAVYLNIVGEKVQAKIALPHPALTAIPTTGDTIPVTISFLSPFKIIVTPAIP